MEPESKPTPQTLDEPTVKDVGKGAFSKISRELTEKDLKNPTVGKMLLDERDRLLGEKVVLESYRENFYKADKRAAIFGEQAKSGGKVEVLYTLSTAVGGALMGLAPVAGSHWVSGALFLVGLLLIVVSILVKKGWLS